MQLKRFSFLILISIGLFCNFVHTASIEQYMSDEPVANEIEEGEKKTDFFVPYYWVPYSVDKSALIAAIEFSGVEEAEEEPPEEGEETTPKTITPDSEEAKNALTEKDIKKGDGSSFKKVLDAQLERAFRSAFLTYVDSLIAEKQTQVKGACAKKVNKITMRKRKEFYKCAEDKLKDLVDLGNKTIQVLYETKQLVSTAITKLKECGKKKEEYIKIREEKEKAEKEKQENQEGEGEGEGEDAAKQNAFFDFFRKAGRFFNENGCYFFVTGEIAINATVLCLDVVMTYTEVKTTFEESIEYIKDCVTKIWDEWMVSLKCKDYVPVLDRK